MSGQFVSPRLGQRGLRWAAGSIPYVIIELLRVAVKTRRPDLLAGGLLIGIIAGFTSDAIVTAADA